MPSKAKMHVEGSPSIREARVTTLEGRRRPARWSEAELRKAVYEFADLSHYSWGDRWIIKTVGLLAYGLIAAIGRSVRWTVINGRYYDEIRAAGKRIIFTFWHNRVFLATWFWRRRGIVVMTSRSFDGEYIARFIQRFGYGAARGSSTRGGARALEQMMACLGYGMDTAFTIDGPRGPVYVAKKGAVLLAKLTGQVILPFHISAEKYWEAHSWDRFQIPYPFTRAVVLLGQPIAVAPDADDQEMERKQHELQATLDALRHQGDRWFQRNRP
jgi:hypothetical protein